MIAPALADVLVVDPLLTDSEADALVAVCHAFGEYRSSSTPRPPVPNGSSRPRAVDSGNDADGRDADRDAGNDAGRDAGSEPGPAEAPHLVAEPQPPVRDLGFRPHLRPRADAARNFTRTGGRFGRSDEGEDLLAARNDYFRETYVDATGVRAPGIEVLHDHQGLAEVARRLYGLPVIVPTLVYANILVPGQELGLHTDVPEFRMAPDAPVPPWMRVVMCHSGLFEPWRIAVATAVVYIGDPAGGAFAYYPEGSTAPVATISPAHRSAVMFDADRIFHGVDRVGGEHAEAPPVVKGSRLIAEGGGRWTLRDPAGEGGAVAASYGFDELRLSVSWKAGCFTDEAARSMWADHTDDLAIDRILGTLVTELVRRGRLARPEHGMTDAELGLLLIDEFTRFPTPVPGDLAGTADEADPGPLGQGG